MSSFKEIVTKAVIGKAKKTSKDSWSLEPEEIPNTVLGCWVINHSFSGVKSSNNQVVVNGSYDVNVWYAYDTDKKTAVTNKRFSYNDKMSIPLKDNYNIDDATDIIVRCLKQPTVDNVNIKDGKITLDIDKEMGVEIVGDTMVKISVEEDEDDYEEIFDTMDTDEISVNEDYLNK